MKKMLRLWNGNSHEPILKAMRDFGVRPSELHVMKYEAITPDSYIWVLNAGKDRYCLYAEDYVSELGHVMGQIKSHGWAWADGDEYELLPTSNISAWRESSPVKNAATYAPPHRPEEIMKYAAQSGVDFVFLAKVTNRSGADYWL